MIRTLLKLAFAGIRTRGLSGVLIIFLTSTAAATIVLTLEVGATAVDPWMRTFEAAHGAHVLASVTTESEATTIAGLPGVAERDAPVPFIRTTMVVDGEDEYVLLAGLDKQPAINAPVQTEGKGVDSGGIVLERSLARALHIPLGAEIDFPTANGPITLEVVGTAILPSQSRYPRSNPGLAWVTNDSLESIEPDQSQWHWLQPVRLSAPATAPAFAETAMASFPPNTISIESWQDQREIASQETDPIRVILTVYTLLLLAVSFSVIAILIGARVSSQYREIALLKAIGLTPRQVSAVFVVEAAALGMVGIVIGFVPGVLLAPRLAAPAAATLVGSPTVEPNPLHIVIAGVPVIAVIALSAYTAARKGTRATVLQAISAGSPAPASRSGLARMMTAVGVPIPMELGLKDLLARRSRAIWLLFAIVVTGTTLVISLATQSALNARPVGVASDVPAELPVLIYTLDAVLAVITLSALVGVALLSVRERIRDFGVLRTIGLTPRQVTTSLVSAHAVIAFVGAVVSIPIGVGLYVAIYQGVSGSDDATIAPWWLIASVPFALALVTAVVTSLPARYAANIPAAQAVRYE
jgi:putative ABC transport system permease protein